MKTIRTESGPFLERPFYTQEEIEHMCITELRSVSLYPESPERIRVDRFVEKRFGVIPQYADLDGGVLGFTEFGKSGVKNVVISKALDEEGTVPAERRIRTTLAHEAGHGLLHAHLFYLGTKPQSLFKDAESEVPEILCRDIPGAVSEKVIYNGRWWEVQANLVMGALLLPRPLVEQALGPFMVGAGSLGHAVLDEPRREEAARALADVFDVNPVVARIRLGKLFPQGQERQLPL